MISRKEFRNNFEQLVQNLQPREIDLATLQKIKDLDEKHLLIQKNIEKLNQTRNELTKTINSSSGAEEHAKVKELKKELQQLKQEEITVKESLNDLLSLIPNVSSGDLTNQQITVCEWGNIEDHDFPLLNHVELGEHLDLMCFQKSASISGAGFSVYKGQGEKLFRALVEFTLSENESQGYIRHYMPVMVNKNSLFCTGQISKFKEQLFEINENAFLSPTGEVQLINMYRNSIIEHNQLPIKVTTNTNCFRNEAVGAGTESKGLIRLFQFNKTEIICICQEQDSKKIHEEMCQVAEGLLKKLNLPYRKVLLANNDLGFSAHKTYDLEVWFPSEKRYREISSISNTLNFQSIRGNIKTKKCLLDKSEKSEYVHILNGSSLAIDRLFAAILDNYQQKDKTIKIPEALKKYLNFEVIEKK